MGSKFTKAIGRISDSSHSIETQGPLPQQKEVSEDSDDPMTEKLTQRFTVRDRGRSYSMTEDQAILSALPGFVDSP